MNPAAAAMGQIPRSTERITGCAVAQALC